MPLSDYDYFLSRINHPVFSNFDYFLAFADRKGIMTAMKQHTSTIKISHIQALGLLLFLRP
jgi:hypothetical protein